MKQLPKVATPIYDVDLPIMGKKIKIRPFLGSEEKILLMAMESADTMEIKNALKQVMENCIVTKDIDVYSLANLDVEKIFIELRRRSVSEVIELKFDLREVFECGKNECPEAYKIGIKLDSIEVKNFDKKKKVIMLNDTIAVSLRYVSMDTADVSEGISKTEALFEMIASVIDEIFDGEELIGTNKDFNKAELVDWVSKSFQHNKLEEVIEFLGNQPYFSKEFEIKCATCGKVKTQEAKGLVDFFI